MTTTFNVLQDLDEAGAVLLDQHFVYKSGKHGSGYINMDPIFPDVGLTYSLCERLVQAADDLEFDTIAAPAVGGVVLATFAALAASELHGEAISAVWADKDGPAFAFERAGFVDRITGKDVLIVEDLLTTGGSVKSVIEAVGHQGGRVVGVSVICNRGGVTPEQLGVPRLDALAEVNFDAIDAEACPLCRDGVPIVEDIGHGAQYKADNPDYPGGYITLQS